MIDCRARFVGLRVVRDREEADHGLTEGCPDRFVVACDAHRVDVTKERARLLQAARANGAVVAHQVPDSSGVRGNRVTPDTVSGTPHETAVLSPNPRGRLR